MLPTVVLHSAVSLDGRIDGFAPDVGLYYELISRWKEDATLAGCDTLLNAPEAIPPEPAGGFVAPKPNPDDPRPLLVVPDSRGRLRSWHHWLTLPYWRGGVALCSESTPREHLDYLQSRKIDYLVTGSGRINLRAALEQLGAQYGIRTVRADCGGTLNGVLLREGLVSQLSLLIHPCLAGGSGTKSFFIDPLKPGSVSNVPLQLKHQELLRGGILWAIYERGSA